MFKNVKLKKILKNTIFKAFNIVNPLIKKRDNIILIYQGNRGLAGNNLPLYDYLIKNEYNDKYRIVCSVENMPVGNTNLKNVRFVNHLGGIFTFFRAKHVYYTAGQIPIKPSKKQIVIHMQHGTTDLKTVGALSKINNGNEFYFTYMMCPSDLYVDIVIKSYLCKKENVLVCGEPMTDVLVNGQYERYGLNQERINILWAPTFKQSDYYGYAQNESSAPLLPCFNNTDYNELNEVLRNNNMHLYVKLHPGQSLKDYDNILLSNLEVYSNDDFNKKWKLYDFMMQCPVLLGDYSSVMLQSLLCDRKLVFVIPDIEEYKNNRGFAFENPENYMPGYIVKSKRDLYIALEEMAAGIDKYKDERKRILDLVHKYKDGKNCQRTLEFSGIKK